MSNPIQKKHKSSIHYYVKDIFQHMFLLRKNGSERDKGLILWDLFLVSILQSYPKWFFGMVMNTYSATCYNLEFA